MPFPPRVSRTFRARKSRFLVRWALGLGMAALPLLALPSLSLAQGADVTLHIGYSDWPGWVAGRSP